MGLDPNSHNEVTYGRAAKILGELLHGSDVATNRIGSFDHLGTKAPAHQADLALPFFVQEDDGLPHDGKSQLRVLIRHQSLDSKPSSQSEYWFIK